MIVAPILHIEQIDNADADRALVRWGHRMGPCRRPIGTLVAHGLFAHGGLVAVTVTADLVASTCAGLSRQQAVELARLCASRADLCRPMVRLWREFIFPAFGRPWAVSYQDEALHTGDVYRFDGWVRLRVRQLSGTDNRSGRKGRSKTVWGWHADAAERAKHRHLIAPRLGGPEARLAGDPPETLTPQPCTAGASFSGSVGEGRAIAPDHDGADLCRLGTRVRLLRA